MDAIRVVEQTAKRMSAALNRMVADLPPDVAPQMALELVIRRLETLRPQFMRLVMEDHDIREAYASAVAEKPDRASKGNVRWDAARH